MYTILHKYHFKKRANRCGFATDDYKRIKWIAENEKKTERYTSIKIIDNDTGKCIEKIL